MTTSNSTNFALNAQQICEAALRLARVLGIGAGVTLNGTLAFTAQHQTKTVIPIGSGVFDVVG